MQWQLLNHYGINGIFFYSGILLNCVLRSKLLNNMLVTCSSVNLNFFQSHLAHFDNSVVLPLLVFKTVGFMLSVFFLHFKQQDVLYLRF